MLVKLDYFPNFRGGNNTCFKHFPPGNTFVDLRTSVIICWNIDLKKNHGPFRINSGYTQHHVNRCNLWFYYWASCRAFHLLTCCKYLFIDESNFSTSFTPSPSDRQGDYIQRQEIWRDLTGLFMVTDTRLAVKHCGFNDDVGWIWKAEIDGGMAMVC